MRRFAVLVAVVGTALTLAACGGSNPNEAKTPANAPTITNAATETSPGGAGGGAPTGGGATTGGGTATGGGTSTAGGGGGGGAKGDVAAGKTFFEGTCQGCHAAGGTQAAVGPKLAGTGLTEEKIRTQIMNGGGAMPPGLAQGKDLDNVTAFVLSLQ